jgi:UDP-hydrolysing UDP-N-acetyl-D-glucosamine 2-epimerase
MQMGEEPWRVTVCGAPSLDNLKTVDFMTRRQLAEECGLELGEEFLLMTFHPVTLEQDRTEQYAKQLFSALERLGLPVVITMANADTGGRLINDMIQDIADRHTWIQAVDNLGTRAYFSTMKLATAMVGNSSSGIIEAASFGLPVVNIGTRQAGRVRGINIIDADYETEDILACIKQAVSPEFRRRLSTMLNPYGSGEATEIIIETLKKIPVNRRLITKQFVDMMFPEGES